MGGGIFYSYTSICGNDNFFGYSDTWFGKNKGYELGMGFSTSREKHFGYTMRIKYRDLLVSDLKDSFNRYVVYTDTRENISLKMSGFIIEMGLYYQFIKIGKGKNEN